MSEESDEGHLDAYDGLCVNPGLGLGVSPKNKTIKLILNTYEYDHVYTWTGKLSITENTRSIHHFMASWTSNDKSYGKKIVKHIKNLGYRILGTLKRTVTY